MDDGQVTLVPQRLERRHRRMQPEEAVQVNHRIARNIDGWPHGIVGGLAVGNHNIQSVCRASLEDDNQPFFANSGIDRRESSARQKRWDGGRSHDRQRTVTQKDSTSDGHKQLLAPGPLLKKNDQRPTTNDP